MVQTGIKCPYMTNDSRPKKRSASDQKNINQLRATIGGVIPEVQPDALPPQPSIVNPHSQRDALVVRVVRRVDRLGKALVPTRLANRYLKSVKRGATFRQLSRLRFHTYDDPQVSIVIPVYNKLHLTVECLRSIQTQVSELVSYEVIVVDNGSSDKSRSLKKVRGLVYVRNENNEGFVGGCNIGAKHARGTYVVFLNNDALVTPDWLEHLVLTLKSSPAVGMVGSKILYPDGRLQEAGGIIFSDGSGNNYGKNDHPDRHQYNYVREVDYCSGASIIIAKQLFDQLGGFDELYAPAYYEDTDLAFRVRQAGLKVLYQPLSVIYHIEGGTAGTDTTSGFKKYQAINHEKFVKRWHEVLKSDHREQGDVYAARDRSAQKLVLIVDELIPTPDKDSGSVRMSHMIEVLQQLGYKVTFLPNYASKNDPYVVDLQQRGVEVVYGPITVPEFLKSYGKYYDDVILSRARIASYFLDACQAFCPNAKIIFDTVDLHFLRLGRQVTYETDPEQKAYFKKMSNVFNDLEKHIIREVDSTLVVSSVEKDILEKDGCENVVIVSNIHKISPEAYKRGFDERQGLLFVGGYAHPPNIDGLTWFVNEIFPIIRKKAPSIYLRVVGSAMPDKLRRELEGKPGVIVDGFVSNERLYELLQETRVFVAPLRYGAGVKGKIGQAIEYGLPTVSTAIGAEGMFMENNHTGMIADNPEDFAEAVMSLYTSRDLWQKIQNNAADIIADHFSADVARKVLEKIL